MNMRSILVLADSQKCNTQIRTSETGKKTPPFVRGYISIIVISLSWLFTKFLLAMTEFINRCIINCNCL